MAVITTASGLAYEDLVEGAGEPASGPGCFVRVHYTGWLENGRQFDSSVGGDPFGFPLGVGFS